MKLTNSPTQGQPNPRKIRFKVAFGPLFPAANNFVVGWGQETQPNQILATFLFVFFLFTSFNLVSIFLNVCRSVCTVLFGFVRSFLCLLPTRYSFCRTRDSDAPPPHLFSRPFYLYFLMFIRFSYSLIFAQIEGLRKIQKWLYILLSLIHI